MKKLLFSLAFMLIGLFASANTNVSSTDNAVILKEQITSYELDGKSYSALEFNKLSSETIEAAKECTVTVTVTVQTPIGPQTFTQTETFEASWFGCLMAKIGAFLASIWRPSV